MNKKALLASISVLLASSLIAVPVLALSLPSDFTAGGWGYVNIPGHIYYSGETIRSVTTTLGTQVVITIPSFLPNEAFWSVSSYIIYGGVETIKTGIGYWGYTGIHLSPITVIVHLNAPYLVVAYGSGVYFIGTLQS